MEGIFRRHTGDATLAVGPRETNELAGMLPHASFETKRGKLTFPGTLRRIAKDLLRLLL